MPILLEPREFTDEIDGCESVLIASCPCLFCFFFLNASNDVTWFDTERIPPFLSFSIFLLSHTWMSLSSVLKKVFKKLFQFQAIRTKTVVGIVPIHDCRLVVLKRLLSRIANVFTTQGIPQVSIWLVQRFPWQKARSEYVDGNWEVFRFLLHASAPDTSYNIPISIVRQPQSARTSCLEHRGAVAQRAKRHLQPDTARRFSHSQGTESVHSVGCRS